MMIEGGRPGWLPIPSLFVLGFDAGVQTRCEEVDNVRSADYLLVG